QRLELCGGPYVALPPLPCVTHIYWASQITSRRSPRDPTPLPSSLCAAIRTCSIVRWHAPACDTGNRRLYLELSSCDNCDRPTSPAFLEASMIDRTPPEITPHTPLRLADAVKIAFPMGGMTVAGLRRERDRNRLVIEKIAGKDFTTLAHIERMRQ